MANTDIFGKTPLTQVTPLTADVATIIFSDTGAIAEATQVQISYSQGVTRRRTIGNKSAVIYGSQPQGQLTMARVMTTNMEDIFSSNCWTGCGNGTITIILDGACNSEDGTQTYACSGCIATNYQLSLNAEDLSVVDNVTIEFLELSHGGDGE